MGIWKLKGCPRCSGDLFLDKDEENRWHEQCLQCSYSNELKGIASLEEKPAEKNRNTAMAG